MVGWSRTGLRTTHASGSLDYRQLSVTTAIDQCMLVVRLGRKRPAICRGLGNNTEVG